METDEPFMVRWKRTCAEVERRLKDDYERKVRGEEDPVREFDTGATRDSDDGKYDYEGFLSPVVWERFAQYMHANRVQSDGTLRASDNWQKGMPLDVYMKSMFRHFMHVWTLHREFVVSQQNDVNTAELEDALCALLFNVQGYLHEWITG